MKAASHFTISLINNKLTIITKFCDLKLNGKVIYVSRSSLAMYSQRVVVSKFDDNPFINKFMSNVKVFGPEWQ